MPRAIANLIHGAAASPSRAALPGHSIWLLGTRCCPDHESRGGIAQGYHDAFIRRLNLTYRARRKALLDALAEYLPQFEVSRSIGGSAVWIRTPRGIDTDLLVREAGSAGVLIEPGSVFFAHAAGPCRHFRMGYSAIAEPLIRDGVRQLARLVPTRPPARRPRSLLSNVQPTD